MIFFSVTDEAPLKELHALRKGNAAWERCFESPKLENGGPLI